MLKIVYQELASLVQARANCQKSGNAEWLERHTDRLHALVREHMPSGSGFDDGTQLDLVASTAENLVFTTGFHHMNEHGSYDAWTDHRVSVRASLLYGITLRVSGKNRNDIKEHIADCFDSSLNAQVQS